MLTIHIPARELWDEVNEVFIVTKGATLTLEHSLVSVSKWEAKWKKPFLGDKPRTREETIDYIRCMTITQHVDPDIYRNIDNATIRAVNAYINDKMTATWFSEKQDKRPSRKKIVTSEVIYSWMVSLGIPFECQKWHLNRLLTLVRVCDANNAGNSPQKKQNKKQMAAERAALNAQRRKAKNTRG